MDDVPIHGDLLRRERGNSPARAAGERLNMVEPNCDPGQVKPVVRRRFAMGPLRVDPPGYPFGLRLNCSPNSPWAIRIWHIHSITADVTSRELMPARRPM